MVGKIKEDKNFPALRASIARRDLEESITLTGYLSDDELKQLYECADVFVFPSLYEGFGLPPLEAMASGVPVVCARTSCMPENLGDAALWYEVDNPLEGARQVQRVLSDKELATSLKLQGPVQARRFSWSVTAERTLMGYEEWWRTHQ
jgi:glycosyltransferase involved in cell wall biosynthesis